MKHYWQKFKESFMLDKRFIVVMLLDILFYAVFVPIFMVFAYSLNTKSQALQGLAGTADISSYFMNASAFEAGLMTAEMQSFAALFIAGMIIVFLSGLFMYSLSRILIWDYLAKQKFSWSKFFKFMLLNLLVLTALLMLVALYSLLMILNSTIFTIILFLLLLGLMYYIFTLYLEFARTGRIFHSIGNSFARMDVKVYLLCLPVFLLISFATGFLSYILSQVLYIILSMLIFIGFASWMRIFVYETQKDSIFD